MHAYMLTKTIDGSNKRGGHPAKSTLISAFELDVRTPFDEGHHAITQSRVWGTAKARAIIDAATFAYYQALIDKDHTDKSKPLEVEFGFYRANQAESGVEGFGESKPYYTIGLKDARVIDVCFRMEDVRDSAKGGGGMLSEYLQIAFIFREATGTYAQGGKTWNDKWDAK
jgi:type VI secretion system Hcp family effector